MKIIRKACGDRFHNEIITISIDRRMEEARNFAKKLNNLPIAIIEKRRNTPNQSEVMHVVGEVKDKDVLMVDDIVDTAGTLTRAAEALKFNGAKRIIACVTHPLLSGDAIAKLKNSPIDKLYTTDSVVLPEEKKIEKIEVLSMAKLFADAIKRVYNKESISELFD